MPPAGFEPTMPARERPQTHVLDRAATGTGRFSYHETLTQVLILFYLYNLWYIISFSSLAVYCKFLKSTYRKQPVSVVEDHTACVFTDGRIVAKSSY
jgi:hypothetical protein